ncbi:MAG: hypothetical protein CW338_10175 [Clostridiales bacterium]|nr:hypothetical protein [Clostridiales bacterium]
MKCLSGALTGRKQKCIVYPNVVLAFCCSFAYNKYMKIIIPRIGYICLEWMKGEYENEQIQ